MRDKGLDQPVGDEGVEAAHDLRAVVGRVLESREGQGRVGVAQAAQQLAAHLPVGAVPALPTPRRTLVGRSAGEVPHAEVSDRALVAAGSPGHTDEGTELHDGDVPRVRRRRLGRHRVGRQLCLGAVEREVGEG